MGAVGGGRSVAPVGPRRAGAFLPPSRCEPQALDDHSPAAAGGKTGRFADKQQHLVDSVATPGRSRTCRQTGAEGGAAFFALSPGSCRRRQVRFRSVDSVVEFTPQSAPQSPNAAPSDRSDSACENVTGDDSPLDSTSPFFGGGLLPSSSPFRT